MSHCKIEMAWLLLVMSSVTAVAESRKKALVTIEQALPRVTVRQDHGVALLSFDHCRIE